MPPVDPSNGCTSFSPLLWRGRCPERTAGGLGRTYDDFCLIFGIPSWLMPLRDRSGQSSQPFRQRLNVVRATEASLRFIGTCGELNPPSSPFPPPFLSLLSGVFLNEILRISPFLLWCVPGRLFVAGNTFLSLLSPSLPLSFFPSRFPLFTLFLGRPWMLSS